MFACRSEKRIRELVATVSSLSKYAPLFPWVVIPKPELGNQLMAARQINFRGWDGDWYRYIWKIGQPMCATASGTKSHHG